MTTLLVRKLSPLALLVAVALACNLAREMKREMDKAQPPKTLTSADGTVQLTIPGGWREDRELNKSAAVQASNRVQEMYVAVISEGKQEFQEAMTLETFADLSRTVTTGNAASAEATDPVPTKVGNYPALEYTLRGTVENVEVKYFTTVVETPSSFHQIITWTLASRFDQNLPTLREVAQSFREVGPGAPPPPGKSADGP